MDAAAYTVVGRGLDRGGSNLVAMLPRFQDANNYFEIRYLVSTTVLQMYQFTAGTPTLRASQSLADPGVHDLTVINASGEITGTIGVTSVNYSSTAFNGATKLGLYTNGTGIYDEIERTA